MTFFIVLTSIVPFKLQNSSFTYQFEVASHGDRKKGGGVFVHSVDIMLSEREKVSLLFTGLAGQLVMYFA